MPDIDIIIKAQDKASGPIKNVGGALEGLGASATNAGGKISTLTVAMGTMLGNLASTGISKLLQLGSSVVTTGVNFDNMGEQAQIAFTTMLGSGEKAQSFLDDLKQFAAATPFEFPELLEASQRMLAMGIAADDIKPDLTAIGDAVAGLGGGGEMIGRITTALGQMHAKGKTSSEEMMQLTEAGIPAWQFLADAIGTDVPAAMKQVTAGTVSADKAISAIIGGMNTKFGGMMTKQSHTFGGLVSTVKDTFTQMSGTVMKPFFDLMTKGLQAIVDWTSKPEFTEWVKWLADGAKSAATWIGNLVEKVAKLFSQFSPGLTLVGNLEMAMYKLFGPTIGGMINGVIDFVTDLVRVVTNLFTNVKMFEDDNPFFIWLMHVGDYIREKVVPAIGGFISVAIDLAKYIGFVVKSGDPLNDFLAHLPGWMKPAVEGIGEFIATTIALAKYIGFVVTEGDYLNDWITHLPDWMKPAVKGIGEFIAITRDLWGIIVTGEAPLGDWSSWFERLTTAVGPGLAHVLESLGLVIASVRENLIKWAQGELTLPEAFGKVWTEIKTQAGALFGDLIKYVKDKLPEWVATFQGWASAAWQWIVDVTPTVVAKLGEWASAIWKWVTDNAPEWGSKLAAFTNVAWNWLTASNGVIAKTGEKLGEWATALWKWITDKAPEWDSKLGAYATVAWNWLTVTVIPKVSEKLGEWATALWKWITDNAPTWATNLAAFAVVAWDWLTNDVIPAVATKLGEWGTALWKWITDNAPTWATKLGEFATNTWKWLTNDVIPFVATKLGEWGTALWGWITTNAPTWGTNLAAFGLKTWDWLTGEGGVISTVGAKLGEWAAALWKWATDPVNLKNWSDKLAGWATAAWQWIADAAAAIPGKLADWWKAITTWYDANLPAFKTKMEAWGTAMTDAVKPFGEWLLTEFPASSAASVLAMNNLKEAFSGLIKTSGDSMSLTEGQMKTFMERLHTIIDGSLSVIILRISNFVATFGSMIKGMDAVGRGDWQGFWDALGEIQVRKDKEVLLEAALLAGNMEAAMKIAGENTVTGYTDGIDQNKRYAASAIATLGGDVKAKFGDALELHSPSGVFKGYGSNTIQGFIDGVNGMIGATSTKMGEVVSAVKNLFSDPINWLYQKGVDAVQGFINGIGSLLQAAKDKAAELAAAAASAVGITLESQSPSKVFYRHGLNAGQGFVNGMDAQLGAVAYKAKQMADIAAANAANYQRLTGMAAPAGVDPATAYYNNYKPATMTTPSASSVSDTLNKYLAATVQSGDFRNDWITHLTSALAEPLRNYFSAVVADKDYRNDWLTHVPTQYQGIVRDAGQALANKTTNFTVNVQSSGNAVQDIRNQVELYALTFGGA